MSTPDYVASNRAAWEAQAAAYESSGRRHWEQTEATWGIWNVPESDDARLARFGWPGRDEVEFHLGHSDWIRLLSDNHLEVTALTELYPPEGATTTVGFVDVDWARRWPSEEVWSAQKAIDR